MLERHLDSDFAGGAFVFPGGTLDDADADAIGFLDGWEELARDMGEDPDTARAIIVCAIRETFEEAGVLLARDQAGEPVRTNGERWSAWRAAVDAGKMSAVELATEAGIRYSADELRFWQRWVTPEYAPKRYDTRFFVAHLPQGQEPSHDQVETTDSLWVEPAEALERARAGGFQIIFPTRKTLEGLASHRNADALWDAAIGRRNDAVLPKVFVRGGEAKIQVPPDQTLHDPW